MTQSADTAELLARARNHDREALQALFTRCQPKVRIAIRRLLGPGYREFADSDDATQDGLMRVFQRLDRFEHRGPGSFLAWVVQHSRREVLQQLRTMSRYKRQRSRLVDLGDNSDPGLQANQPSPSEQAVASELEERLFGCLEQLPAKERDAIVLRRYVGLTTRQLQEELQLPTEAATRALLSRATANLAKLLPDPASGA